MIKSLKDDQLMLGLKNLSHSVKHFLNDAKFDKQNLIGYARAVL